MMKATGILTVLVLFSPLLGGCKTAEIKESRFTGHCKELGVPAFVSKPKLASIYSREYMLAVEKYQPLADPRRIEFIGQLEAGTKIIIREITYNTPFNWPPYLRVVVEVKDGPFGGLIADIPVCAPGHPSPRWIRSCTLDPNGLDFDTDIIRDCRS